jgi:hypothetical protein
MFNFYNLVFTLKNFYKNKMNIKLMKRKKIKSKTICKALKISNVQIIIFIFEINVI